MKKVLLADKESSLRRGLRMRIELEDDISIVGETGGGAELVRLAEALQPDVVILDIQLPTTDSFLAIHQLGLVAPQATVVVLTLREDSVNRSRAEAAGAAAFFAKYGQTEELISTIRQLGSMKD